MPSSCLLTIGPQNKTIHQVHANQYLVYPPESIIGNVECLNQSNTEFFLQKGISQMNVSPTSRIILPRM
jgi:hypothetical protein